MKYLLIILLIIITLPTVIKPQQEEKSKIVMDEKSGRQMLIGEVEREALNDTTFSWWYVSEYNNYKVKDKELAGLKDKINAYEITIVMGTWCSDSRREIPRFLKILDTLQYPAEKVKFISVDRNRKDLSGEVESLKIELVPTIIFFKDGKEEGRITETPIETLETDTYNIVNKTPAELNGEKI